jgi:hypothetical protein
LGTPARELGPVLAEMEMTCMGQTREVAVVLETRTAVLPCSGAIVKGTGWCVKLTRVAARVQAGLGLVCVEVLLGLLGNVERVLTFVFGRHD